jgi:hypothetical protein
VGEYWIKFSDNSLGLLRGFFEDYLGFFFNYTLLQDPIQGIPRKPLSRGFKLCMLYFIIYTKFKINAKSAKCKLKI